MLKYLIIFCYCVQLCTGIISIKKGHINIPKDGCDSTDLLILKIFFGYFKDTKLLSIVDDTDDNLANSFKCVNGNSFLPLIIRNGPPQGHPMITRKSFIDNGTLNPYPTSIGTTLRANQIGLLQNYMIPKFAENNPRGKLLCFIKEFDYSVIKNVLKSAYDKYKTFNSMAISLENGIITLCAYNPFRDSGFLLCKNITNLNYDESIEEIKSFNKKRVDDLHLFPLKIYMFEYPMVSKAVYKKNKEISHYEYIDGEIVSILSEVMNFTPVFLKPDSTRWGRVLPNGTFTGAIKAVESGEADLCGNTFVITDYNTTKSLILKPIATAPFFFVIPRPETAKELLVSMFFSFDFVTRTIFILTLIAFPFILNVILKFETVQNNNRNEVSIFKSILLTFGIMLNISIRMSEGGTARIFYATVLFYALIQSSLFQSTIIKNLNANIVLGEINTLDQILDNDYEIITVDYLDAFMKNVEGNRMLRKLNTATRNESIDIDNPRTIPTRKKIAILMVAILVDTFLDQFYDNVTKQNIFTVVPELVIQYYASLMLPKNSPLQDKLNDLLQTIAESGIIDYQFGKANSDYKAIMIKRILNGEVPGPEDKRISIIELQTVFFIYAGFICLSFIVFCIELLIYHIKKIFRF